MSGAFPGAEKTSENGEGWGLDSAGWEGKQVSKVQVSGWGAGKEVQRLRVGVMVLEGGMKNESETELERVVEEMWLV